MMMKEKKMKTGVASAFLHTRYLLLHERSIFLLLSLRCREAIVGLEPQLVHLFNIHSNEAKSCQSWHA